MYTRGQGMEEASSSLVRASAPEACGMCPSVCDLKPLNFDKLNIGFLEARCAFPLLQLLLEKFPCLLRLEYIAWCIKNVILIRKASKL